MLHSNVCIKRSKHGQLYFLRGLSKKAHFILGQKGLNLFHNLLRNVGIIQINEVNGFEPSDKFTELFFVQSKSGRTSSAHATTIDLKKVLQKASDVAEKVIPYLLKVSVFNIQIIIQIQLDSNTNNSMSLLRFQFLPKKELIAASILD